MSLTIKEVDAVFSYLSENKGKHKIWDSSYQLLNRKEFHLLSYILSACMFILFFFLEDFFKISLQYSYFTMMCYFLLYSKSISYTYIPSFSYFLPN